MRFLSRPFLRLTRYRSKQMVRPWALSAPVLVLLVALPLLRPLRYPHLSQMSDDEKARVATVQAIVEHHTLAIDGTDFVGTLDKANATVNVRGRRYSDQPPMMSALLAGSYWVMHGAGLTLRHDASVMYLLTLLGVTLPAACAAGLVYRMGRLFELRRWWRAALAAASVLGTGLISYATVLNPHAPAAVLVLAAAACLVHVAVTPRRLFAPAWVAASGACAALAAAIHPSAIPFLLLFVVVVASFRWKVRRRAGSVLAYAAGAALPVALHAALVAQATGSFWQGVDFKPQTTVAAGGESCAAFASAADLPAANPSPAGAPAGPSANPPASRPGGADEFEDEEPVPSLPQRVLAALVGWHGVFSHFPVLLLGFAGVGMVMHRHWPTAAKVLASATVAGALFLVIAYAADRRDWHDAMFASRWFVVFGPLTLFWAGAWLRRPHRPAAWAAAGVLLAFSTTVSLLGAAAGPLPREGFDRYTAAGAWRRLVSPHSSANPPPVLAGRY